MPESTSLLPELAARLAALLDEIDDATGGQADSLVGRDGTTTYVLRGAQESLLRQEQEFRALVENNTDVVLRLDTDLRLVYGNPALLRMAGLPLEDAVGMHASALPLGEGSAAWLAVLADALNSGQVRDGEFFFTREGRSIAFHSRIHPERDPKGRVGSLLVVSRDTSSFHDARRDQDSAQAAIHHQALLLDTVEQAVIATDLEERITSWNRFAEHLYGWRAEEVVGRSILEVVTPRETAEGRAEIIAARARHGSWSGQLLVRRKDGTTFLAQVTETPIFDATGVMIGIVGVSWDVTERLALEEQLRQSQKMEAVGQLAGGVAHDFNNLLTVIKGTVELLRLDMADDDVMRQDIDQIGEAADRAAGLTRQLLAFSRRQILRPQPLDLGPLTAAMLPMLKRLIGEDIELEHQSEACTAQVQADPGQVEQVLLNLVVNARDAMPQGGRIVVRTEQVEVMSDPPRGGGEPVPPGRYIMLSVRDNGSGIPPELRERIFEPFFTTKEQGLGTGLGLSTVYGVVQQSGGYIAVESEVDHGTEFRVYFPARTPTSAAASGAERVPAEGGSETVLLIEDEDAVRTLTRRVLTRMGYTVVDARDAVEAFALARQQAERFDLVISDVVMPRMSGSALAEQLSAVLPGIPVLFMSGYTNDEILRRGIETADTHFLQKPFTPDELLKAVRAVLD